jgi:hypothetical protein
LVITSWYVTESSSSSIDNRESAQIVFSTAVVAFLQSKLAARATEKGAPTSTSTLNTAALLMSISD